MQVDGPAEQRPVVALITDSVPNTTSTDILQQLMREMMNMAEHMTLLQESGGTGQIAEPRSPPYQDCWAQSTHQTYQHTMEQVAPLVKEVRYSLL